MSHSHEANKPCALHFHQTMWPVTAQRRTKLIQKEKIRLPHYCSSQNNVPCYYENYPSSQISLQFTQNAMFSFPIDNGFTESNLKNRNIIINKSDVRRHEHNVNLNTEDGCKTSALLRGYQPICCLVIMVSLKY